jgi:GH18 family chitinase
MTLTLTYLLLALAASLAAGEKPRLVGYLPYWATATLETGRYPGLTDLMLFSGEPRADGSLDAMRLDKMPWEKVAALRASGVRVHLCLGGWGRSRHFAAATADPGRRGKFVGEVARFCTERGLDGVDLDWEHPRGAAELAAYGLLIDELKAALVPRKGEVTLTLASAGQLPPNGGRRADRVQLMAYDMPGRHATSDAAQTRAEALIAAGVPANRLILGVPFYGRGVTERDRTLPYREILVRHSPRPEQDDADGLHFNGPVTMASKAAWVRKRGLGGMMVWELTQDASGEASLLQSLRRELDRAR